LKLIALIALIVSGSVIHITLSQTPAFNSEHRFPSVMGTWRTLDPASMYDIGAYEFQRGYGYLMADVMLPGVSAKSDDGNEAIERADAAIMALERSLRASPGDAHVWASLGWAYARTGYLEQAREKLMRSWVLAPHNATLARTRMDLSSVIFDSRYDLPKLTKRELRAIQTDLSSIDDFHSKQSDRYRKQLSKILDTNAQS